MSAALRAILGAAAWVGFVVGRVRHLQDDAWALALLLFAVLVLVPLALDLFRDAEETPAGRRLFFWIEIVQLPAALSLAFACWMAPGTAAMTATLPWVAVTGLMAVTGVLRIREGGWRRELDGWCRDAALIFALIGGAWTLADRSGWQPLHFDRAIVALTAVHFHFAGLLLPLFAGLTQRELFFWRFASRAAVGVVLGVPAVALGITMTQLGWGPSFEAAAGCGLALAGMVVGILHVRIAIDGKQSTPARVLIGIAGASLFIAMAFAALYAIRSIAVPFPGLGIPQMRMLHGTLNAIGFGLCGVLGWRRATRENSRAAARG